MSIGEWPKDSMLFLFGTGTGTNKFNIELSTYWESIVSFERRTFETNSM